MDLSQLAVTAEKLVALLLKHIEQGDNVNEVLKLVNQVPLDGTPASQLAEKIKTILS